MIVSDTTPLSVFLRIDRVDLLVSLFSEIIIAEAVAAELDHGHAAFGGSWQARLPQARVQRVSASPLLSMLRHELDQGESEAIALAVESPGHLLLIDEAQGRLVAR